MYVEEGDGFSLAYLGVRRADLNAWIASFKTGNIGYLNDPFWLKVNFISPKYLEQSTKNMYADLIINVHSMDEMEIETIDKYIRLMVELHPHSAKFSMNYFAFICIFSLASSV